MASDENWRSFYNNFRFLLQGGVGSRGVSIYLIVRGAEYKGTIYYSVYSALSTYRVSVGSAIFLAFSFVGSVPSSWAGKSCLSRYFT
jgi:hypothetical protein